MNDDDQCWCGTLACSECLFLGAKGPSQGKGSGRGGRQYCPCGGVPQDSFDKNAAISYLRIHQEEELAKLLGSLAVSDVGVYARELLKAPENLFCYPISCILCNRCVSDEVKSTAKREMDSINKEKLAIDPTFKPRDWEETVNATRKREYNRYHDNHEV